MGGEKDDIFGKIDEVLGASAFLRYRGPSPAKVEWIFADAIRVDHSNDYENADQVPRMRDIYRSASVMLGWLGLPSGSIDASKYGAIAVLAR